MSEPSEAIYEAAMDAYLEALNAGLEDGAVRALVDTVWALARRQAAADIRAKVETVPVIPLRRGARLVANVRPDVTVEWAARIAEGTDHA